jgi:hypothetical protein
MKAAIIPYRIPMLQVPAMTWLRISSGAALPFRFHLLSLLVTASPFIIWFVTYRIWRKPASYIDAEQTFQSAKKPPRRPYYHSQQNQDRNGN